MLSRKALSQIALPGNTVFRAITVRGLATVTDSAYTFPKSSAPQYNAKRIPAALKLKTGQVFNGISFGAPTAASGEAVFTTSLVGYPESMTDPSYRGQILVFTQPLIGNYGIPGLKKDRFGLLRSFESDSIQCEGIVVNDYATHYSHWTAVESLGEWCARHNIPAISGVDTRAIVHLLRNQGSTLARVDVGDDAVNTSLDKAEFIDPNTRNLVAEVSTKEPVSYNPYGDINIAVVDCGVKHNILRSLVSRGAAITVLPWDFDFNSVAHRFDGLFISNGPGNPTTVSTTVQNLRTAIATFNKPIFGICMGNLLLGMAAGMGVRKMRFGNRGHNVPAVDQTTGLCAITSQNHGYCLMDEAMPKGWTKYFINANDGSNEGIRHVSLPIKSVQFHPEAKGGPEDTEYLFDNFVAEIRAHKLKSEGLIDDVRKSVGISQSTQL